jgi:hypothetical protein
MLDVTLHIGTECMSACVRLAVMCGYNKIYVIITMLQQLKQGSIDHGQ